MKGVICLKEGSCQYKTVTYLDRQMAYFLVVSAIAADTELFIYWACSLGRLFHSPLSVKYFQIKEKSENQLLKYMMLKLRQNFVRTILPTTHANEYMMPSTAQNYFMNFKGPSPNM